jgi:adenylate cyclase
LVGVKAVVAAPILDRHGTVIGALYGDYWRRSSPNLSRAAMRLQTMLVELIASGVAVGLARVEQEQAALRSRIQFEQFFTAELSRQLAARPDLLQGRDAEVTILFCDIRGFSRISSRLGPAGTVEWIRAVLGALSDCVLDFQGVLVDYIGDELAAMWGAPEDQLDHAGLACRAALAMLDCLPRLNERWQPIVQEPIRLGIGINTGAARVGNIGTHRKFKYGPLGAAVNLASRVQGATKYLKTSLVITEATHARLGGDFAARRLGKVRLVNIDEPISLYEVVAPGRPDWPQVQQKYEEALTEFERGDYVHASRTLGSLVAEHRDDGPLLVLLARAINAVVEQPTIPDVVWELPGK